MAPFLKIVAPLGLLMRFLSFGNKIFGFPVKFCMEMMILRFFANGSIFEDFGSSGSLHELLSFLEGARRLLPARGCRKRGQMSGWPLIHGGSWEFLGNQSDFG